MAERDWNSFVLRNSWSSKAILGSAGDLHVFFSEHLVSYTGAKRLRVRGRWVRTGGLLVLGGSTITTTNVIRLTDLLKLIQHLHKIYEHSSQKDSRENKMCTRRGGVWGWQVGRPPQTPLLRGPRASSLWVCQAIFSGKLEMLIYAPLKILLQGQIP